MAWNSDPKVRELGLYADQNGYKKAVVVGIKDNMFEIISYGKNRRLCEEAKKLGERIGVEIETGEIPT